MTDLSKMTLVELVEAIRVSGTLKPALAFKEIARRQRMLEAAEGMAKAMNASMSDVTPTGCGKMMGEALAAYDSAKETP